MQNIESATLEAFTYQPITLRGLLAGLAMQGLLADGVIASDAIKLAVKTADLLIAELESTPHTAKRP